MESKLVLWGQIKTGPWCINVTSSQIVRREKVTRSHLRCIAICSHAGHKKKLLTHVNYLIFLHMVAFNWNASLGHHLKFFSELVNPFTWWNLTACRECHLWVFTKSSVSQQILTHILRYKHPLFPKFISFSAKCDRQIFQWTVLFF